MIAALIGYLAGGQVIVNVDSNRVLNTFKPDLAFGAGVDGHEEGDIDRIYTKKNLQVMRSAGLKSLTYRLRTELAIDAFHWNPVGKWSDSESHQGYWTSSDKLGTPIRKCYGYRLPRRGSTFDQANDDGYSRLDDGDPKTFWKSNPYLDPAFSGDRETAFPQWIVVDLGVGTKVNALKIRWANPFAVNFRVEYCDGPIKPVMDEGSPGEWKTFPGGNVTSAHGGIQSIKLGKVDPLIRFVRIWLLKSSHTSENPKSLDKRDKLGFAIREIELGSEVNGKFVDAIRHRPDHKQSPTYASSTDPWHREKDIDLHVEQPGFDLVLGGSLTNNLPAMVPVPIVYDTPENATAQMRYLKRRGYKLRAIEMGEEPDGQYILPEHFASLYGQFAKAIRKVDTRVPLGGPCFQTTETDVAAWPDEGHDKIWLTRFMDYLRDHGSEKEFQFFSFEWYPFDDMKEKSEAQVQRASDLMESVIERLKSGGLTRKIPWYITEYGYSAYAGPPEVDIPGALLNLDIVGKFFELGGSAAYLFGYEPGLPFTEASGLVGNLMMIEGDADGQAKYFLPTYYAARMMGQDWCIPGDRKHYLIANEIQGTGSENISAYSVRRPDGTTSIMLINKDAIRPFDVSPQNAGKPWGTFRAVQYGRKQYQWKADGNKGYPIKSEPPSRWIGSGTVTLPPFSATILTEMTEKSALPGPPRRAIKTNPNRTKIGSNFGR